MHAATRRQLASVLGLLGIAAVAALTVSPTDLITRLEGLTGSPVLFVAVIVAVYLIRPFFLWPMSLVAVALGYLYSPWLAIPVAIAGGLLTATPPYLIGRYAQTDVGLFGTVSLSGERLVDVVGETRTVLAARLSPVPGDPISYGAGISGVSPRSFYVATAVGEVPWAVVAVFTGASLHALSLSEFSVGIELLVFLSGVALLLLGGPVYTHVRSERSLLGAE